MLPIPGWNPFVRSIDGTLQVGRTITVVLQPPGAKRTRFRPTVLSVVPNSEFVWKGRLLLPGLFDGEHYFRIESLQGGKLIFRQGEIFSGILVPFLKGFLNGAVKNGFIAMNEAIKREAEKP